jgi:phospholipid-binding lipoprotein MlaA
MISSSSATPPSAGKRLARLAPLLALTAVAAGCAHVPNPNPKDPWESYNRSMYKINDTVDKAVFKPVAQGYNAITPQPVQTCVHNMYSNVGDVWSAFNSFIQGHGIDFFNTMGRVLFNTTMGLGGCIDVASMNGARRIPNDFGVTLGVWGFKPGPYVVLPFVGPSSVRDGVALGTTLGSGVSEWWPVMEIDNIPVRNSVIGLGVVDARDNLLDADKLVNDVALDKYSFIRDAYMQRRKSLVNRPNIDMGGAGASKHALPDYSDDEALPDYSDDEAPGPSGAASPASSVTPAKK